MMRPGRGPDRRAVRHARGDDGDPDRDREGLLPAPGHRRPRHGRARRRRRPRHGRRGRRDGHGGRAAGRVAGRPLPGRRGADRCGVLRQHGRQRGRPGPASCAGFVEASTWPDRARCSTGWPPRSASRPPSWTASCRPPPPRTSTPSPPRSACGTRWRWCGEPYRQWVLQDSFVAPRPPWELDGALFVPDVAPYQLMKLRLLNGSHSALAYLGAGRRAARRSTR